MAAPQTKQLINLLPQEEFASSTLGRVLTWLLSTFRMIVIITEIVVMAAFGSRFVLDATITDLNDEIKIKTQTVQGSATFEKKFRDTQGKIRIVTDLTSDEESTANIISDISAYAPADTTLLSFTVLGNEASLRATTPSELSVSQFMANLKGAGSFDKIELTQLANLELAGNFVFTLNVGLKGARQAN